MAVATDEERGLGPGPPQHGEEPYQAQGIFSPRWARARAQAGGHHGVGGAREKAQRHRAIPPVVGVRECAFLLAMRGIIGVIEVEHTGRRWLRGARDAVGNQRVGEAVEVLVVDAVFKARKGGGTCQVLCGL